MEVLIENDKAKWVDGNECGRWQKIKNDDNGSFIRKGVEIIYINSNAPKTSDSAKSKPVDLDEHDLKIYHAYWKCKSYWDNLFPKMGQGDYYYYRGLCVGMPKSFFNRKI